MTLLSVSNNDKCGNHSKDMDDSSEDLHFQPFTVLLGIVLGSVFSITFGLSIVCLVFWILQDEEPRLAAEFGSLVTSTSIFFALSLFAAGSFVGSLRQTTWRYLPMAGLWASLLLAGRYYWPG
jgi:hypothetical protein